MTASPGVQDASTASASLLGATAARGRLAGRARWTRPFYLVLAAGTSMVMLSAGLTDETTVLVVTAAFLVVVAVMVVRVVRQGVVPRGFARLHVTAMVVWGVLYAAALQMGMFVFPGVAAFWLPAVAVVAAPLVVAAVLAGRPGRAR